MNIDLSILNRDKKAEIDITGEYNIPKEYYQNSDVLNIESVKVEGVIRIDEDDSFHITCKASGIMSIQDSISLEEVKYPFSFEYDDICEENCKKSEILLDIFSFLWENIVLEVPLQFTKVSDLSKYHGDGWRLISEDEHQNHNNPFSELLKDYDKE